MWSSVWEKWWVLLVLFYYLMQVKSRMYNTLNSRYQQLGTVFFMQVIRGKCKINEGMQMTLLTNLANGKFIKGDHNVHCDRWSFSF